MAATRAHSKLLIHSDLDPKVVCGRKLVITSWPVLAVLARRVPGRHYPVPIP